MKKIINIIFCILLFSETFGQIKNIGLPPYIRTYTTADFNAANQNWSAVQDNRGILYFANNYGVLEFDGKNWKIIRISDNSAVRSLAIDQRGTIYVGGRGQIGFLKPDSIGRLIYNSLNSLIPEKMRDFQDVWRIYDFQEDGIYFYSDKNILVFKDGKFSNFYWNEGYEMATKIGNKLFAKKKQVGFVVIENGKEKLMPENKELLKENIRGFLPYKRNQILILTYTKGIFLFNGTTYLALKTPIDNFIKNNLYNSLVIEDNYLALNLYSNGLLITDLDFNVVLNMNANTGLPDNRIYNMYLDNQKKLWLLSTGITCIELYSPFSVFDEHYGLKSPTESFFSFNNELFIGSRNGLFSSNLPKNQFNNTIPFQEIKDERGTFAIWKIDTIERQIYAVSEAGFFNVNKGIVRHVFSESLNLRTFTRLEKDPNHLIVGSSGLRLLEKNNNAWKQKAYIKGFSGYCTTLKEDFNHNFWISDKSKGIYKLKLNATKDSVEKLTIYDTIKGLRGLPSHIDNYLFKIREGLIFCTQNGIYKYDYENDRFYPYEKLNNAIGEKIQIIDLNEDSKGNIWFKTRKTSKKNADFKYWDLAVLHKSGDTTYKLETTPFYKYRSNIFSFGEISPGKYIIGTSKGFIHYDQSIKKDYSQSYPALIRGVEIISKDSVIFGGTFFNDSAYVTKIQNKNQVLNILYDYNALRFTFSAAFYEEPEKLVFKYFLENNDKTWSDWKTDNTKEYSNLPPGEYIFHVKAKNLYEIESTEAIYRFVILPPWYRTVWAFICYVLLLGLIIWGIVRLSIRRLRLQNEMLERIVTERTEKIRLQNTELEAQRDMLFKNNIEIAAKNRDITASIAYAKRIQDAMLPLEDKIKKTLSDYFILFKPRDIVSGDFYWFAQKGKRIVFTAVDCTGHGVPGAFMSMIGAEILTTIVNHGVTDAAEILTTKNEYVRTALKQEEGENQDGMDMALCVIDLEKQIVEFAGAKNPLVYICDDKLEYIKGDKQSIGGHQISEQTKFTKHIIPIKSPMWFYVFSDGYQDQFGGPDKRKFMIKAMKELLLKIHKLPMTEQKEILDNTITDWMKEVGQTDDILVIGFKI